MSSVYQGPFDFTLDLPIKRPSNDKTSIYCLIDPRDGQIRYVGKANNPLMRYYHHAGRYHLDERRTYYAAWMKALAREGVDPILRVVAWVDKATWAEAETAYIADALMQGYRLVNTATGGQGPGGLSSEQSAMISARQRGQKLKPAHAAKVKIIVTRHNKDADFIARNTARMKELWADPVFAARETERIRVMCASPEYRANIQAANRKKYEDHPDLPAKIGAAHKKLWQDPEHRVRTIASLHRHDSEPEHRKKLSDGLKRAWADPERKARWVASIRAAHTNEAVQENVTAGIRRARAERGAEIAARQSVGIKQAHANNPDIARKISDSKKAYWARWREKRAKNQTLVQLPLF